MIGTGLAWLGGGSPLIAAPMAGGVSTPRLVTAVAEAGAFAFLAGGYKTAEALHAEIGQVRDSTESFGVNLFAPNTTPITDIEFRRYARELQPEAERFGLDLSQATPLEDDDRWRDKLDLLLGDPVPVVSVTFGVPRPADVTALRRAGSQVLVTVTTAAEARAAAEVGADALVVQGSDAGGHNGTHDALRRITPTRTQDITLDVVAATGLAVVATGGVDGSARVAELLQAGASAVAVGTLLLPSEESGASQVHKDALTSGAFTETVLTRAFTGRPARALRNGFTDRHDRTAPAGYPAIHHLTKQVRQAAAATGDAHRMHLWAGTGFRSATTGSARHGIERLTAAL